MGYTLLIPFLFLWTRVNLLLIYSGHPWMVMFCQVRLSHTFCCWIALSVIHRPRGMDSVRGHSWNKFSTSFDSWNKIFVTQPGTVTTKMSLKAGTRSFCYSQFFMQNIWPYRLLQSLKQCYCLYENKISYAVETCSHIHGCQKYKINKKYKSLNNCCFGFKFSTKPVRRCEIFVSRFIVITTDLISRVSFVLC